MPVDPRVERLLGDLGADPTQLAKVTLSTEHPTFRTELPDPMNPEFKERLQGLRMLKVDLTTLLEQPRQPTPVARAAGLAARLREQIRDKLPTVDLDDALDALKGAQDGPAFDPTSGGIKVVLPKLP